MSNAITFRIPGTIDAKITPNSREHWAVKSRLTKELRNRTARALLDAGVAVPGNATGVHLDYVIAWEKGRRFMDDDNIKAGCKGIQDSIAEHVGINDRNFILGEVIQTRDVDKTGYIGVVIVPTYNELESAA